MLRRCSTPAPTRCRSTQRRSERPDLIDELTRTFGAQCVVLAIDAKQRDASGWEAYLAGGRRATGRDAVAWAKEGESRGAQGRSS